MSKESRRLQGMRGSGWKQKMNTLCDTSGRISIQKQYREEKGHSRGNEGGQDSANPGVPGHLNPPTLPGVWMAEVAFLYTFAE